MSRQAGFTLVEMLFALVAGSLLLITLGWAIRGLEDQYRRHAGISATEKLEAIAPFVDAEIARALPPANGGAFAGNEAALELTGPPPKALGAMGPLRLTLSVVAESSGKALVARFAPMTAEQSLPASATQPVTLAEGFRDIRFSYLRRSTDDATMLPRLVTLQFQDQSGTILPLGVEPRITMGADCVFDPIAQACRR
jgi:prepilin-type N-terminal cleavage/methylation domain-containing protein